MLGLRQNIELSSPGGVVGRVYPPRPRLRPGMCASQDLVGLCVPGGRHAGTRGSALPCSGSPDRVDRADFVCGGGCCQLTQASLVSPRDLAHPGSCVWSNGASTLKPSTPAVL